MKLYLSSYHLGERAEAFAQMFSTNKKVAIISNALDFSDDLERRANSIQREVTDLQNLNLEPDNVDLRDYFGNSDQLQKRLASFGGVWVRGGNSFILRRAFAYSGLDMILKNLIPTEFVYSGFSAGACVVTPTLKGIHLADEPEATPPGYQSEVIWEGLNFVPYSIAPHYQSDHPEASLIQKSITYFIENNMPYVPLRDGEDIIEERT